jgi:hypothetical protein
MASNLSNYGFLKLRKKNFEEKERGRLSTSEDIKIVIHPLTDNPTSRPAEHQDKLGPARSSGRCRCALAGSG